MGEPTTIIMAFSFVHIHMRKNILPQQMHASIMKAHTNVDKIHNFEIKIHKHFGIKRSKFDSKMYRLSFSCCSASISKI